MTFPFLASYCSMAWSGTFSLPSFLLYVCMKDVWFCSIHFLHISLFYITYMSSLYNVVLIFNRVNPKFIVYHSLVSTDRQYMRNVITIDPSWLTEAAPHFYQKQLHSSIPQWCTIFFDAPWQPHSGLKILLSHL